MSKTTKPAATGKVFIDDNLSPESFKRFVECFTEGLDITEGGAWRIHGIDTEESNHLVARIRNPATPEIEITLSVKKTNYPHRVSLESRISTCFSYCNENKIPHYYGHYNANCIGGSLASSAGQFASRMNKAVVEEALRLVTRVKESIAARDSKNGAFSQFLNTVEEWSVGNEHAKPTVRVEREYYYDDESPIQSIHFRATSEGVSVCADNGFRGRGEVRLNVDLPLERLKAVLDALVGKDAVR